jgi:uncharacterized protein (TIGR02996 family)
MSDQGAALLQAIADAPEDDTPRLVYADWLDEHGDGARAEFIRVQIERARLPRDDNRQAELAAREKQLLDRHRDPWLGTMPNGVLSRPWARGFPEAVGCVNPSEWREWQLSRDDLASLTKAVEQLPIREFGARLRGCGLELLAEWPLLRRLRSLNLSYGYFNGESDVPAFTPGLQALALSQFSTGITSLNLNSREFEPGIFHLLGTSERLPCLAELTFEHSSGPTVAAALGWLQDTPLAARLRSLACSWTPIPLAVIRRVLDCGRLTDLKINLDKESEAEGISPLLGSAKLAALRAIGLTGEEHGFYIDEMPARDDHRRVPGLRELLSSRLLARLEVLSLHGIDLGDEGARILADSPCARNLICLDLDLSNLTGAGLRALRPLLAEGRLRSLSLNHNPLTDADAMELASWPEFRRLHELNLGYVNYIDVDQGGKAALWESPHRHAFLRLS